jgi:hypothetical protein
MGFIACQRKITVLYGVAIDTAMWAGIVLSDVL